MHIVRATTSVSTLCNDRLVGFCSGCVDRELCFADIIVMDKERVLGVCPDSLLSVAASACLYLLKMHTHERGSEAAT